jgi:rubrerythrin
MKTSQEWWDEVKNSPAKFNEWLVKQYRGEVTAAQRIMEIIDRFDVTSKAKRILAEIAEQEKTHAEWVLNLLKARGVTPSVDNAGERYWKETLPAAVDFETTAAIGAHAEQMRLERIEVIAADKDAPFDVRETFSKILKQELWHAEAFKRLAGPDAIARTKYSHEQGRALLGLVP